MDDAKRKRVEIPLELDAETYKKAARYARHLGMTFDELIQFIIDCDLFEAKRQTLIGREK